MALKGVVVRLLYMYTVCIVNIITMFWCHAIINLVFVPATCSM